ncbi:hypothetical protein [Francisella sp. SYW-2]|uniref:hypothetical protein n=1 Tax=Francisella sp. SYW-2 TaxID=2610886 RepID=UPI00123D95B5|nr:hypothetical protein [Francisella sp. SYW-2]
MGVAKVIEIDNSTNNKFILVAKQPKSYEYKTGTKVKVYRNGKEIFDPETGESLGFVTKIVGYEVVTESFKKIFQVESEEEKEILDLNRDKFNETKSLIPTFLRVDKSKQPDYIVKEKEQVDFRDPKICDTIEIY